MVNSLTRERARQRRERAAAAPARAVVTANDDAGPLQTVQAEAMAGELIDGAERVQDYGFASHPHAGAEAVAVFGSGHRNHPLVIAVADRRYRLQALAAGEVALHDDLGQVVHLTRDGIEITTPLAIKLAAEGAVDIESAVEIALTAPKVTVAAEAEFSVAAGVISMLASGLARLAGAIARLHGTAQVAWDAAGTGFSFTPTARKYHYTGTTATELPPAPPEVP